MSMRGRAGAFQNGEQRGANPILRDDVGLDCESVAHLCHIADVNHRAVHLLDRQIIQHLQDLRAGVEPHVVFAVANFLRAGWQDHILYVDRVAYVDGRQTFAVKFRRIDIDHDLARFASVRQRHLRALHRRKLGADEIQSEIVKLLFGKRLAAQANLQNRNVRRAVLNDERRRGAGRHDPQQRLANRRDLRDTRFHFCSFMEKNFDDRNAVVALRLDVLDIVHGRGHGALANRDEALFHFFRRDAGVAPDDAHDRDVDVRKNVSGHARDRHDPKQHDEDGHHREGVRASKS